MNITIETQHTVTSVLTGILRTMKLFDRQVRVKKSTWAGEVAHW